MNTQIKNKVPLEYRSVKVAKEIGHSMRKRVYKILDTRIIYSSMYSLSLQIPQIINIYYDYPL